MTDNNKTTVSVDLEGNSTKAQSAIDALIEKANHGVRRMQALEQGMQRINNVNVNPAMERAERQAIAGRDRRAAFGGAALLGAQTEVLRNYAMLGAGIGAGGFLGNFAVTAERELANLQAISQATAGDMEKLGQTFEALAQNSKFAFQEIAAGSVVLAQAGFSAREIDQMLGSIMNLATATGSDFATAVDIATSVLSVFHLQAGEVAGVTDMLTEAMNRSKLNIEQFRLGVQYAGNIAAEQGVGVRELTAAFAAMADQGIRSGSTLGTGLRQLLIDLADPTEEARLHFEAFGLSMQDLDVRSHGLTGVLRNLRNAGFSSAEGFQTFEVRAAAAFAALEANPDAISDLMEDIDGTGAAARAAAIQMDTLTARFTQFGNAAGVTFTRVMEPVIEALKDVLVVGADVLSLLSGFAPVFSAAIPVAMVLVIRSIGLGMVDLVKGILAYNGIAASASGVSGALAAAVTNTGRAMVGAAASTGAFVANIAGIPTWGARASAALIGVNAAAAATAGGFRALTAVMLANPFTAALVIITSVVTALAFYKDEAERAAEAADELATSASELSGNLSETQSEIETLGREIERLSDRSAGLATATLDADERQQALNEIVLESIGNVDGLSEALDGQVTSIEQVQRALRGMQMELIETAARQAELLEVTLRQQAAAEGRAVEAGFDRFRRTEGNRLQAGPGLGGASFRPVGDGLPRELQAMLQQFTSRDTFDPQMQRELERALTRLADNTAAPEAQREEANRVLREMGERYLAPLARQMDAEDQAEQAGRTALAGAISERLSEPLMQLTETQRRWNEEIARVRDGGYTPEERQRRERELAARPEFAGAAQQFQAAVAAERTAERERLLREGRTGEQADRELARVMPLITGMRDALELSGEVRSAGRTPIARSRRGRRGPSAQVDLLKAITDAEEADVDAILAGLRDLQDPETIERAAAAFEEQWTEYQNARIEQFEAEWANKDYTDPAQAQLRELAVAELERELATELEAGRRRFGEALIDGLRRSMQTAIDAAQREFERVTADADFRVDRMNGLANRGRFGDVSRGIEERRAEEARIAAIPALIESYNAQLELARAAEERFQEALRSTTDPARQAQILNDLIELRETVAQLTAERDAFDREHRANTEPMDEIGIFNTGGSQGTGPGGIFSPEFGRQVQDAVNIWAEASGVMRDASDVAVEAITGAFDALNTSMKESFKGILTGTMDVEDAVKNMALSVLDTLLDMAIEIITNAIIAQAVKIFASMFGAPMAQGGKVKSAPPAKKMAAGYRVQGGIPGRDSVPILAMPGEYMIRKSAADMIGKDTLDRMNYTGRVSNDNATNVVPMAMKRDPDTTNVWVVQEGKQPQFGPKDVVATLQRDATQNGPARKLIKQIAMGG